jgi:protein gp37
MADKSAIEWCEATLNAWTGCRKVSAGCAKCFIEHQPPFRIAGRKFVKGVTLAPDGSGPVVYHLERIDRMVRRRKPTVYFVNSLSDVFLEDVPDEVIALLFAGMACAPQHTFQVLTKRPERMQRLLSDPDWWEMVWDAGLREMPEYVDRATTPPGVSPDGQRWLRNVWLGVTVENRAQVKRADVLRATPAAVRFLSCEPLIGPVIAHWSPELGDYGSEHGGEWVWPDGKIEPDPLDLSGMDWVIAGGESGPGARPCREEWLRDLRDACERESLTRIKWRNHGHVGELGEMPEALGPPRPCRFFLKQLGGHPDKRGGDKALLDGRLWHEMPPLRRAESVEPVQGSLLA